MSAHSNEDLSRHVGHEIECCTYFDGHAAIECLDCSEVLLDFPENPPDPAPSSHHSTPEEAERRYYDTAQGE